MQPRTAPITKVLLTNLKWEVFGHLSYASNFASLDSHLFLGLKKSLGGGNCLTNAVLGEVVLTLNGFTSVSKN